MYSASIGTYNSVATLSRLLTAGSELAISGSQGKKSMPDKVDVLIVGSGASGAAVAWSLADTRMRILCLEQGDWVKPTDYPSNGRDWEARLFSDFAINPNRRARPTD
jgi:hypothetical protein